MSEYMNMTITDDEMTLRHLRRNALGDTVDYVKRHRVSSKMVPRRDEFVPVDMSPQEHFIAVYEGFLAIYMKAAGL